MEEIEVRQNFKRDFVGIAVALQFFLPFIIYLGSPGYIIPFLNNPFSRQVVFLILIWQALGLALYAYSPIEPKRKILFGLQTTILLLVFLAPLDLAFIIGPAICTPRIMAM